MPERLHHNNLPTPTESDDCTLNKNYNQQDISYLIESFNRLQKLKEEINNGNIESLTKFLNLLNGIIKYEISIDNEKEANQLLRNREFTKEVKKLLKLFYDLNKIEENKIKKSLSIIKVFMEGNIPIKTRSKIMELLGNLLKNNNSNNGMINKFTKDDGKNKLKLFLEILGTEEVYNEIKNFDTQQLISYLLNTKNYKSCKDSLQITYLSLLTTIDSVLGDGNLASNLSKIVALLEIINTKEANENLESISMGELKVGKNGKELLNALMLILTLVSGGDIANSSYAGMSSRYITPPKEEYRI